MKNEQKRLTVKEYRDLYEGATQRNASFRDAVMELDPKMKDITWISDLEQAQNRLTYAMLGIQLAHTLPCPEIEVSGVVHFDTDELCLYSPDGEQYYNFADLDPKYVSFLREQRTMDGSDELILSSVALRTSQMMLQEEMETPDLKNMAMNVPEDLTGTSRQVLERAFSNSMVLMNHLQEEMEKYGLDKAYGTNKDELIQHVSSNMFDKAFEHSLHELEDDSKSMVANHEL